MSDTLCFCSQGVRHFVSTKPVTMTAETATKVSHFIMSHRGEEKVKISWFGGEPLVNVKVIDQICGCDCTPERRKERIYDTVRAMKDEYENYLNKIAHETEL